MYQNIKIKGVYRTKKDNIDTDLIIPLLRHAKKYDRGTGFFNISALSNLADGLIPYLQNNGVNSKIRIITSVELAPEERMIIQKGEALAYEKTISELQAKIEEKIDSEKVVLNMDLITNLIAANMLEIRIAYLSDGGIYHEKIGLFESFNGEKVCFIGSPNETYSGYRRNVECISTLRSWREGDDYDIKEQEEYFEELWNGRDEDIIVVEFPKAQKMNLFTKYKYSMDVEHAVKRIQDELCNIVITSKEKTLHDYQKIAIAQWEENGFCHFFEMATGTGKTFTAVKTIEKIKISHPQLYVVILVPQIDLQAQWENELIENGMECYLFGGLSKESDWKDAFNRSVIDYYNEDKPVISVCIYDTFFSKISAELDNVNMDVYIIVDEAHELSRNQIDKLSNNYIFRLGLSATPERHEEAETNKIINFFTKGTIVPYEYTIDEAIGKFLSNYEYHPIWVRLTDEEFNQYKSYTQQIIMLYNQEPVDYEAIKDKLQVRGVIVKKAKNKLDELESLISKGYVFSNSVVYCGQGKENDEDDKIINIVSRILKEQGDYSVSQFTSHTDNRKLVLAEFEKGYYDVLVAIKCFDQGVDVPKLDKIYIMASDSLRRQTIQRRGRVLRKCTETGKKMAYIYDMVVLPPYGIYDGIGAGALVRNELKRVDEYLRLAKNKEEYESEIEDIRQSYNVEEDEGIYEQ